MSEQQSDSNTSGGSQQPPANQPGQGQSQGSSVADETLKRIEARFNEQTKDLKAQNESLSNELRGLYTKDLIAEKLFSEDELKKMSITDLKTANAVLQKSRAKAQAEAEEQTKGKGGATATGPPRAGGIQTPEQPDLYTYNPKTGEFEKNGK